ncbi:hypothetical protein C0991_002346, partial [Blastosporella zonata]
MPVWNAGGYLLVPHHDSRHTCNTIQQKQEQIEHYEGKLDTAEGDPRDSAMDTDGPAHAEATFLNRHTDSLMNNADLLWMLQDMDFDQPAAKGRTAAAAP